MRGAVGPYHDNSLPAPGCQGQICSEKNHAAVKAPGATPFIYNKDWMQAMEKLGGTDLLFDPIGFEIWGKCERFGAIAGLWT